MCVFNMNGVGIPFSRIDVSCLPENKSIILISRPKGEILSYSENPKLWFEVNNFSKMKISGIFIYNGDNPDTFWQRAMEMSGGDLSDDTIFFSH
ncbi:hypothetical protein HNW77_06875 [Komagataeibacter sp. AV436]|uniref:Uncharacterized protein n=1 Tax=Komagataeibacter melomenusus TaxID=2766578 RepID=A0ABX2ACT0_9PROT|nr:hypothetical protein [Komagataeibacter melomenusus]NPC66117.1 hypothetical protein [Komagataeibacter melomenusus]